MSTSSNCGRTVTVLCLLCSVVCSKSVSLKTANDSSSCSLPSDLLDTLHCPVWFKPSGGLHAAAVVTESNRSSATGCQCGEDITEYDVHIHCDGSTNATTILTSICVTYSNETGTVAAGNCPFNFMPPDKNVSGDFMHAILPSRVSQLNEVVCGPLNRTGLLCGQCKEGLGPAILSYRLQCVECLDSRYGWLVYLSAALLPTTIFCIILTVFQVDLTSAEMNIFILACQLLSNLTISCPSVFLSFLDQSIVATLMITFYGFWNLDFFRGVLPPFCLDSGMNTLQVFALDYIVALYPLLLTAVMYYCIEYHARGCRLLNVLWYPFHKCFAHFKCTWNLQGSVINVFASFLALSYSKVLFISISLLHSTIVYNSCGERVDTIMYFDSSVKFFHKDHLPYALLAIVMPILFCLCPLVLVTCYQYRPFHRFLALCRLKSTLLFEMAKVCQKSFKNGTNRVPDYRWFAGVYLFFRIAYALQFFTDYGYVLIIGLSGVIALTIGLVQPHNQKIFTVLDSVFFGWISFAFTYTFLAIGNFEQLSLFPVLVLCSTPLVYFVLLVSYKVLRLLKPLKCSQNIIRKGKRIVTAKFNVRDQNEVENDDEPHRLSNPDEYTPLLQSAAALERSMQSVAKEEANVSSSHRDLDSEDSPHQGLYTYDAV